MLSFVQDTSYLGEQSYPIMKVIFLPLFKKSSRDWIKTYPPPALYLHVQSPLNFFFLFDRKLQISFCRLGDSVRPEPILFFQSTAWLGCCRELSCIAV